MTKLSQKARELIEGANFGHLSTVMADGTPQVSPVWIDTDGDYVLVNTAEGRLKTKNVRRNPAVALSVTNQQNPYEALLIRGRVVDVTTDGAEAHIDKMAKKYIGQDTYPWRSPTEQRVILKIEPEKVSGAD